MNVYKVVLTGALLLSGSLSFAEWKGTGELGALSARGNTNTDNANAKLDISNELPDWKHAFYIAGLYGANNDINSANRWETRWQSNYNLTQRLYWFGGLRYERDHFGAFKYQESVATGLGYHIIDNDRTKLSAQLGVGAKRSREQTVVENEADEVINRIYGDPALRGVVTAGAGFEHALTATTKIIDKLVVEATSDNTLLQNDLALQVAISEKFSLSVGYGVRQNTSPPIGTDRLDTQTTLNVVYKID